MTTAIDYALMAGASYISNRDPKNQFPTPQGWMKYFHVPNNPDYPKFTVASGFEAVSFQNTANPNEIVISYAGTDFSSVLADFSILGADFWHGNIPLAAGNLSDQLRQAADYYLQVKALNPTANITFTGHSLGGGLASLMAVLFDETAYTFDQAPFRIAGRSSVFANENRIEQVVFGDGSARMRWHICQTATDTSYAVQSAWRIAA